MGAGRVPRGCLALQKRSEDQTDFVTLELKINPHLERRAKGPGRPMIPDITIVLAPPKAKQANIPDFNTDKTERRPKRLVFGIQIQPKRRVDQMS